MPDLAPILAILVGAFSLLGGLLGWDLLMNHRQARLSAIGGEHVAVRFVAESQYQPPAASAKAG